MLIFQFRVRSKTKYASGSIDNSKKYDLLDLRLTQSQ